MPGIGTITNVGKTAVGIFAATAGVMGTAAHFAKFRVAEVKAQGLDPIRHPIEITPAIPVHIKRSATAIAAAPAFIASAGTPFMLMNIAKQTNTPVKLDRLTLLKMFLANLRVSTLRGTNSTLGKSLTAEEAAAVKAAATEEAEMSGLASIKLPIITAFIAVLDNFIAGLGNAAKMDTLRGYELARPKGILASAQRTAQTAIIGSSVRLPVSALQAGFFLSAQPIINSAIMAHGYSKEKASAASIVTTSVLLAIIKNPTDVIQKTLLKQAANSPTFARSLVSATKEAVSLHGRGLLTVGLSTTIAQVAIIYAGLTLATELANTIVPEEHSTRPSLKRG